MSCPTLPRTLSVSSSESTVNLGRTAAARAAGGDSPSCRVVPVAWTQAATASTTNGEARCLTTSIYDIPSCWS